MDGHDVDCPDYQGEKLDLRPTLEGPAFLEEVQRRNTGVSAELIKLGGTRMNEPCPYAVIIDRISHEVPYYRSYLKNAVLQGVTVINNPFMWTADDKFFESTLAVKLGVAKIPTMLLIDRDGVLRSVKARQELDALIPKLLEEKAKDK